MDDRVVRQVDARCALVEAPARSVVGVGVLFDNESRSNVFQVARKLVVGGTAPLLAQVVCGARPGRCVGVATDVGGAGRLRYVVGVEAPAPVQATAALPEGAHHCAVPGGLFARIEARGDQMNAYTYYVGAFREQSPHVCDPARLAYHVYGADGALEWIYEPVCDRADADPLAAVHWALVSLPPVRFAGLRGAEAAGMQTLFDFFAVEDRVRSLPVAAGYTHQYLGFPCRQDPAYGYFGAQVEAFDGVPDEFSRVTLPGGEYVRIGMHEMNGDDPMVGYAAREGVLALLAGTHAPDPDRVNVFQFHLGTSASVYVPVKRMEE